MNKCKFYVCLLIFAICLISSGAVMAGIPESACSDPSGFCSSVCTRYSDCMSECMNEVSAACGSSSGSGSDEPVVYIRPEDGTGEYYIDENGMRQYVSYKSWDECMKIFGDAGKCSTIVTDECQSCIGYCQALRGIVMDTGIITCSELCSDKCNAGTSYPNCPTQGGSDNFGEYYYENCQKKYSNFFDFFGCYQILGNVKDCVDKYSYGCSYTGSFYVAALCKPDDTECLSRVMSEYLDKCGGFLW